MGGFVGHLRRRVHQRYRRISSRVPETTVRRDGYQQRIPSKGAAAKQWAIEEVNRQTKADFDLETLTRDSPVVPPHTSVRISCSATRRD
jgi:hypothetical protein